MSAYILKGYVEVIGGYELKVTILNPDEVRDIFEHWGNFSKVCYDSAGKPEAIGKHCIKSGHFSGSRSRYIEFLIEDCPRFLIDQMIRKEVGTCKNVQSFRYVNKDNFAYEIPKEILDNSELLAEYRFTMRHIMETYELIQKYVLNKGLTKERANEQARYVLPMATHGAVAIGFTIESFIEYCHKRLCVRTEDVHREAAIMMRDKVLEILPELKDELVSQCEYLTWCPEKNGCGKYPRKGDKK